MKGLKYILVGIMLIIVGSSVLIDTQSSLGGYGEVILFILGILLGIKGLNEKD